jgi:hypothetical protein
MAAVRAVPDANPAAIALLDAFRGESEEVFPVLAGTLPHGSLAQRWATVSFTVPPGVGTDWTEFLGPRFDKWRRFCDHAGFEPDQTQEYLSLSEKLDRQWLEWQRRHEANAVEHAVQIGAQAGGESLWVLPDGAVWLAGIEPGEVPFLELFNDLTKAIEDVHAAIEAGDLLRTSDEVWRWGDRAYEGDEWRLVE